MNLPGALQQYLADQQNIEIRNVQSVSGGSINQAVKLQTNKGDLFLKWNRSADPDMFGKEFQGLNLLREADTNLYIPEVLSYYDQKGDIPGFLLMEFTTPAKTDPAKKASAGFGQQLALLHQHTRRKFGLDTDNYIGKLPQSNSSHDSWPEFFIQERIEPQLELAVNNKIMNSTLVSHWEHLAAHLTDIFPDAQPSLLHGDLWSGNYFFNSSGQAVLIDPAVYYGHPEMELSFTRMFGGFSKVFYDAYESVTPLEAGFADRIPVYNLYPLMVHANLFGGHYANQATSFLQQY